MPIMRSLPTASATISRYRGSKMCSGKNTFGNRTTFGSGKIDSRSDITELPIADCRLLIYFQSAIINLQSAVSVNRLRLLVHVVHQDVLAERIRRREVCLALADVGHPPNEANQVVVARQHERVDHDPALAARRHLSARFGDDERVEAEG